MKRFKNILYVAETGVALNAFQHAVGLAERNNARLTVILVTERIPPYLTRLTPPMFRQARIEELKEARDRLTEWVAGRIEIETKVVEGKFFLEIIREVLRNGRDLVVKAAGGNGGKAGWLFGTADMHLLRKCPCPVWLIKSTETTSIRRIMATVDYNEFDSPDQDTDEPLNRMILELAGSLATLEHSELHVVHAWEAIGENVMRGGRTGIPIEEVESYVRDVHLEHRHWLDRLLRKARKWIGPETYDAMKPKTHVPNGMPGEVIPALTQKLMIDLIVMGTVARTGIAGLIIGNTAESILSQVDCSVLAVKPPGFVTPVTLEG